MEIICSDIVGPFRVRSFASHAKYFQLHTCRLTGYMWVNFHAVKSTASAELMQLGQKHAAPLGLRIRILQSDSDALYKDARFKAWAVDRTATRVPSRLTSRSCWTWFAP
jgi:hypothetical protein